MRFNIEGRMRNMRLPEGRTALLYSIFEAVMNGIQAIEEKFPKTSAHDGRIVIEVVKSDKAIQRIIVADNGIGLNEQHFESFNECDTLTKVDIGGRGVGRLVWDKGANQAHRGR